MRQSGTLLAKKQQAIRQGNLIGLALNAMFNFWNNTAYIKLKGVVVCAHVLPNIPGFRSNPNPSRQ